MFVDLFVEPPVDLRSRNGRWSSSLSADFPMFHYLVLWENGQSILSRREAAADGKFVAQSW